MPLCRLMSSVCVGVLLAMPAMAGPIATPPETMKKPETDKYHGVEVVDEFRWLEDWSDPEVKAWSDKQNDYARAYLDQIKCVPELRERVTEIETAVGDRYLEFRYAGGKFFASKSVSGKQQPQIVVLSGVLGKVDERVVVDPNALDEGGGTSFDWFVPSPDGTLLAVSLSSGGSESGDVRVFEVETGKERAEDLVPRVNGGTAGGSLAWTPDCKGFFYTRYPRGDERPEADHDFYVQVYHHELGTPTEKDTYQAGKDYPRIAEIVIEVSHDGKWVLTNVQDGDGGQFIQDVRPISDQHPIGDVDAWTRLSTWEDRVVEAKFGRDGAMYLVSRKNAPNGKVMRLALNPGEPVSLGNAKPIIGEQADASIETSFFERTGLYLTEGRLFVLYQTGGPNELRAFDLVGEGVAPNGTVEAAPISTIEHVEVLSGNDLMYQNDSFVAPPAWYVLLGDQGEKGTVGRVAATAFKQLPPPHMPDFAVRRAFATSKDGTKVPLNIVARKDVLALYDRKAQKGEAIETRASGSLAAIPAPALVWGYGGYGVNQTPAFSRRTLLFCEQGGIMVFTNIRGGGEYGEKWHREGNLTKKQNVFDDFQACCQYLIDNGYTTSEKLAITGGSNGGLLMGATFTQKPNLAKAVVSSVGIYDMLRVELSPNGAFNITEFGTVKDKEQFDALYAYSPYHRVQEGVKYPAVLFMTGANDPRVDPMQSRKMTALMQSAQASVPADKGGPSLVLLRTSGNTGHGSGTPLNVRIEQTVDTFAFLFDQLGMKYERPGKK